MRDIQTHDYQCTIEYNGKDTYKSIKGKDNKNYSKKRKHKKKRKVTMWCYKCPICQKIYTNEKVFDDHLVQHKRFEANDPLICEHNGCFKRCYSKIVFKKHFNFNHGPNAQCAAAKRLRRIKQVFVPLDLKQRKK